MGLKYWALGYKCDAVKGAAGVAAMCCALSSVRHAAAATVVGGWDFQNTAVGTNTAPASDLGSVTGAAASLGMTNTYGTPSASTDISDILLSTGSSDPAGAANNAWRVRGGPVTAGQTANGWSSLAPIGTQGAQYSVSTVGFSKIGVTFDLNTTTQAEANLQLQYTIDGVNYVNAPLTFGGTGATIKTNSASPNTVNGTYIQFTTGAWYNQITADLSGITAANNNPNFGIRIVNASTGADNINGAGTAYNNSSGNWRFDEVQILANVPEPTSLGLLGVGGLLMLRRRRGAAR